MVTVSGLQSIKTQREQRLVRGYRSQTHNKWTAVVEQSSDC